VFGPRGRLVARLGLDRTGVVVAAVPGKLPATLFARGGLWIPFGLALGVLGFGLAGRRIVG
jgi:apolipoprotein N-acyltransferase